MYDKGSVIKFILVMLLVTVAFSHVQSLNRGTKFNEIRLGMAKTEVIAGLGSVEGLFMCRSEANPPELFNDKNLCAGKAAEVDSFQHCYITQLCPGWNYVSFDKDGHALSTYAWDAPYFQP